MILISKDLVGEMTILAEVSVPHFLVFSTSQTQDMHGHQFHFLAKDEQVTLKTCPYCGRPYPNPQADYRRCPNCLAKLK